MVSIIVFIILSVVAFALAVFAISEKEMGFTCLFMGFALFLIVCAISNACGTPIIALQEFKVI